MRTVRTETLHKLRLTSNRPDCRRGGTDCKWGEGGCQICHRLMNINSKVWKSGNRILNKSPVLSQTKIFAPPPRPSGKIANEDFWSPPRPSPPLSDRFCKKSEKIRKIGKHIEKVGKYPTRSQVKTTNRITHRSTNWWTLGPRSVTVRSEIGYH